VADNYPNNALASEMIFLFREAFKDASLAISRFTGNSLLMSVKGVELVDIFQIQKILAFEEVPFVAIRVDLYADIRGSLIMLIDRSVAQEVAAGLLRTFGIESSHSGISGKMGENESSVLIELTNIIASKIASRLSDYLNLNVAVSPPNMIIDMPWSAMQEALVSAIEDKPLLFLVRTRITSSKGDGLILFVPDYQSYQRIVDNVSENDFEAVSNE